MRRNFGVSRLLLGAVLSLAPLTSLWGEPGKSEGKSVYRINDAGKSLEIVDAARQNDGSWKEFSRFKLTQGH